MNRGDLGVDAHGRAVVPGFIDSHVHFMIGGESLEHQPAGTDPRRSADRLKAFSPVFTRTPPDPRRQRLRPPDRADLTELVPNRPAYIVSGDVHSLLANARALAAAGVTRQTPDPANGKIVRDEQTGEATGRMLEAAQGLVTRAVPMPTRDERPHTLDVAMDEAHRSGVTSIVNIGGPDDIALFDEARNRGSLAVRIYSALWVAPGGGDSAFPAAVNAAVADLDRFEEIRARYKNDDVLSAQKIMLDGVIEWTADMLEPYRTRSKPPTSRLERLRQIVTRMDRSAVSPTRLRRAIRLAPDTYEVPPAANWLPADGGIGSNIWKPWPRCPRSPLCVTASLQPRTPAAC